MASGEENPKGTSSAIDKAVEAAHVQGVAQGEFFKQKEIVRGYDFDKGLDHHELLKSFITSGFQSTLFARAVNEVNKMVSDANGYL